MAENYISAFYTWSLGNTITAARLNGNVSAVVDGLDGGLNAINVLKVLIGGTEVLNSSREVNLTKATIGNIVLDDGFDASKRFSVSGAVAGTNIATIALGDNSGAIIEVFGSGLKGASIATNSIKFSIYRTTGTMTISRLDDSELADGDDLGGRFEVEADGNNVILKAYTDAGTWAVAGRYTITSSGTVTIS